MGSSGKKLPSDGTVTTGMVKDGDLINADISSSASIAWSKINTSGMSLKVLTTVQRDALSPSQGEIIFNSTTGLVECYNGATWLGVNGFGK